MTEEEWLIYSEPVGMLLSLQGKYVGRKLRLCTVACYGLVSSERKRPAWDIAAGILETVADGLTSLHELETNGAPEGTGRFVYIIGGGRVHGDFMSENPFNVAFVFGFLPDRIRDDTRREALKRRLADLVREIFGNPFRPVAFDAAWRTDTAIALARQMYESRDFSAMPILADALQDSGCDNPDILEHCRDTSLTHVRGCWVVDLVLGKE
jgi:hypothetical protein